MSEYEIRFRAADMWLQMRVSGPLGGVCQSYRNGLMRFEAETDEAATELAIGLASDMKSRPYYFRQPVTLCRINPPQDGRPLEWVGIWKDEPPDGLCFRSESGEPAPEMIHSGPKPIDFDLFPTPKGYLK